MIPTAWRNLTDAVRYILSRFVLFIKLSDAILQSTVKIVRVVWHLVRIVEEGLEDVGLEHVFVVFVTTLPSFRTVRMTSGK